MTKSITSVFLSTSDMAELVSTAFTVLQRALREDLSYAQGWHDNLACAAIDEGVDSSTAQRIATRFMYNCFTVRTVQPNAGPEDK